MNEERSLSADFLVAWWPGPMAHPDSFVILKECGYRLTFAA